MIYRLNIQEGSDYYLIRKVRRKGPTHKWETFQVLRYVNVYLHECIKPKSKGKVKYKLNSAISALVFPVPKAKTKPFTIPPPFKKSHNGYNEPKINQYFARILKSNQGLSWDLKKAVYTTPAPAKVEEKLAMRCMAHTYGGELLEVNDLDELVGHLKSLDAGSPNKNPQLVGFLGHGRPTTLDNSYDYTYDIEKKKKGQIVTIEKIITVRARTNTLQGRVVIGGQEILEDLSTDPQVVAEVKDKIKAAFLKDKRIKKLIKNSQASESDFELSNDKVKELIHEMPLKNNQVLLTDQGILDSLIELRKNLSPLAVIGIYHCHNGRRTRFLQMFANSVRRPVFAYTGFLGWFYTSRNGNIGLKNIENNWTDVVKKRLVQQEFNYQKEKFTNAPGDWVMATPMKVRIAQIVQDASGRSTVAKLGNQPTMLTKQAITFTVEISQGAPSKYQWYEDKNPIGENTAQLRIVKDKPGKYSYRCKVTDSIGATADSNLVTLKVS